MIHALSSHTAQPAAYGRRLGRVVGKLVKHSG